MGGWLFTMAGIIVTVPYSSPRHVAESQGRVVALDPGIRSFLTFYVEDGSKYKRRTGYFSPCFGVDTQVAWLYRVTCTG